MKEKLTVMMIFLALISRLEACWWHNRSSSRRGWKLSGSAQDTRSRSAAKFAVGEQQQKAAAPFLWSIKRADTQLGEGVNYRLCLKVKP